MHSQRRVRQSASARPAASRAIRRTYSTVFGQRATTDHRISIFSLHAFSHSHRSSRIRCGNPEVVTEGTWTVRLSASRYGLGGKIAYAHIGLATTTCNNNVNCFETNASGQTLVEYVYLGDMPLAMVRPTEQVYYYHNDHLGTPRVMTNASGAIVWKAAYNAFGNATVDVSSTITNNLRFPGQYYDTESGLHYNWNRYYDPNTGRYITADPIGLEGGVNVFGYVGGNPVNWVDPEGLQIAIPIPPPPVAVPGPYKYKPMPFPSLPSLPEPNNPVSITPPSAGALLAQNIKHWLDVIQGNLNTAQEHANKCNSSSPDNQDQHKWRQEIKAALDKAKKIAEKRLSGKAKAEVLKTIERIANSI